MTSNRYQLCLFRFIVTPTICRHVDRDQLLGFGYPKCSFSF